MQTDTPNELIGVLAHETAHMAAGHLAQLREALRNAQILSVLAVLGGAAAAVAGGGGDAAAATALGGGQIARRSLLSYQRGQERSADRAAVTYLEKTGQSSEGMLKVFSRLADQQLFASRYGDPYVQSHPMAADRISQIEELARKSKYRDRKDPAALQLRHDMMRAKFIGFIESPQKVSRLYPAGSDALPARYAQAVLAYRVGSPAGALKQVDALIASDPSNPWLLELKGQILTETGKPGAAIAPLRRAVSLAPNAGYLQVMLGHAQVASGDDGELKDAIRNLTKGLADDPGTSLGYRQLAIAYARSGDIPLADLATAQGHFAAGDTKAARQYAARAQAKLKRGTPAWLRADDIISYKPPRL
ncbi:M48 family metalloprotease [Methylobrevis pamukkalensis]|uniref:TPR repeat-containing protein YfgC n=1 Tax=Methylobrevis pamukkalensis TaxID=1439726 RepID=A0A1E3H091_9HYPH|nr:M48 family metalloprotease [Methylobrevis pamukkalensis]ODN69729.1 TPR repeat-containing protein YfgC precursor [Methylobrevis pamukkalensis]